MGMRAPIFVGLSLAIPIIAGVAGYHLLRTAKRPTNMGEAIGPYFAVVILLTIAAAAGEVAAIVSLVRGERLGWLGWLSVVVNGGLLISVYLALTGAWK